MVELPPFKEGQVSTDMIDQIEIMRLIENLRGDAIVVPAMRANVGWSQVSNNINRDVPASGACLLYTSPSPRDRTRSRMPSSA